jgi:hypothetical protein
MYVLESGRLDSGSECFARPLFCEWLHFPRWSTGSIVSPRTCSALMLFFLSFPVLNRAHFCALPSSGISSDISPSLGPSIAQFHRPTGLVLRCLAHFICPLIFTTDLITRGVSLAQISIRSPRSGRSRWCVAFFKFLVFISMFISDVVGKFNYATPRFLPSVPAIQCDR